MRHISRLLNGSAKALQTGLRFNQACYEQLNNMNQWERRDSARFGAALATDVQATMFFGWCWSSWCADPKPSRQLQKTEPEWEWVSSLWEWHIDIALCHIHLSIRSSYCIATTTSPAFSWSKSVNCAAADSWGKVFCLDKPSQGLDTIAFDEHFTSSTQQSSGIPLINLSIESYLSAI